MKLLYASWYVNRTLLISQTFRNPFPVCALFCCDYYSSSRVWNGPDDVACFEKSANFKQELYTMVESLFVNMNGYVMIWDERMYVTHKRLGNMCSVCRCVITPAWNYRSQTYNLPWLKRREAKQKQNRSRRYKATSNLNIEKQKQETKSKTNILVTMVD